ncbi:AEC family transporter [Brevibacterium gallinarum]|uniref:AEC family transporter n=1 Tax=Brevibacterium gallinarum TaxID=2762220 RepID=A0ABR8WVC6_9MICO|nr:AEC family transporter [Brevibacterium gallinarum]MBD8020832.1 AEC family transporter [Brevibacterium gallinarum]
MDFVSVVGALIPVASLIAFGWVLRRLRLLSDPDFWSGAEKLAYFVLLPVLLFRNISAVDISHIDIGRLAAALVLPIIGITIILFALNRVLASDQPSFTSVVQGAIRFNTYIGLSLSATLFGPEGAALAAIVGAVLVPLVNVLSSIAFELFLVDKRSWLALGRSVILNPLVLGCAAGAAWNVLPVTTPEVVAGMIDPLAAAALPIGLLCVGAGIRRFSVREHAVAFVSATVIKLLIVPAVTVVSLLAFDVRGEAAVVGLIFQSIATASSAYVMARQLGGNATLMAALIAGQTVISMLTLPIVLTAGAQLLL